MAVNFAKLPELLKRPELELRRRSRYLSGHVA